MPEELQADERQERQRREARAKLARVTKRATSGCLEYCGKSYAGGYGMVWYEGRMALAHRVMWLASGREIPPETPWVLHKCDNRLCCELTHLFLGTRSDNAIDMAIKHRGRKSKSGLPFGVKIRENGRYSAQLHVQGGKKRCLGTFATIDEAHHAALLAKEKHYAGRIGC